MAVVIAIDAGTTGVRAFAVDDDGHPVGLVVPRVHPALPPARAGSSTTPTRSGRAVRGHARPRSSAALDGEHRRRHRHHQPARDGRGVGPRAPASRCTAPSSGRTGAPPPAATSCATPATSSRSCARRTGLVLDPYFSATKLEWLLTEGGVDGRRRPRARHRRLAGCSGTSPAGRRRRARHRAVQRQPHDALRHRRARTGPTSCSTCSACRARACPRCCPSSGRFGVTAAGARPVPAGIPVSGIAGDQQAALFGQACFEPGHDQEHLRHRLVRAHERRADAARRRSTGCSPRWRGRSPTAPPPTRSRARSSSPAPRSSGCATASASSTTPPRSGRSPRRVARHRRRRPRARVHRARQRRGGIPYARGHDRRHHPRHRPRPTSPGPSSRRWPSRPATWSTR